MSKKFIRFISFIVIVFAGICTSQFLLSFFTKPVAIEEKKPHCWVESYPVKKLLRQVSWRDKTFIHDVNVHNAYEISEGDMNFVLTVEAESKFDPEAIGDSGNSHWFCQWHETWQSDTLNNPNFKDPVWQMEECFKYYTEVFNNGTINSRLYWYPVRHLVKDRFKFETEWKLRRTCES